ncbi:MAG: tripartite tricarboxylate transporter TctB family protein [Bacillota bacterium]
MRRAEQWISLVMMAISLGYFGLAFQITVALDDVVGPRAFPMAVSLVTAVLCGVLLLRSRAQEGEASAGIGREEAIFAGMGLVYWLLLPVVGYLVATALFVAGGTRLMGERRWGPTAAVAVGTAVASWALFDLFLGVTLPTSLLGFM